MDSVWQYSDVCCCTQVGDGVFEVLSTSGDTHLGGDDFDKRIVDFLADDFKKNEGIDLRKDRQVRSLHFLFAFLQAAFVLLYSLYFQGLEELVL